VTTQLGGGIVERQSPRVVLVALLAMLSLTGRGSLAQEVRVSERLDELEARARRDSTDAAAHYNLALGYLSRNQYDRADTALSRAVSLDPQFAPAWLAWAVIQTRNQRFWAALRRSGPGDSALTAELRRRVGFERRAYLIDPFVDLRILGGVFRFEDYGAAIEYYLGRDFRRFSDGVRSGMQGLTEGDYERAWQGFQTASAVWYSLGHRLRDTIPEFLLFYRGLAAAHTNRTAEAIDAFQNLVARNVAEEAKDTTRFSPLRTNEYRYMLAALHQRAGDGARAADLYREVATADLGNYMAHVQLARIHEAQAAWDAAIAERRFAAQVSPEDHTLQLDLGTTLARAGRMGEAEEALRRSRELNPRDARVHYRLGIVLLTLGRRGDAREALTTFLSLAPSRYGSAIADARTRLAGLQ
jgi:tetratricopeptide (TPR) repeat protein